MLLVQRVDAKLRGVARRAPAGQHQMLGAMRGKVSRDFQADRPQSTGHQIRCVIAQCQRCRARCPNPTEQPGHVDRLTPQRELVFAPLRKRQLGDESRPFVGGAFRQVRQPAPLLRLFQRGGTSESPQGALIRRDGVGVGDSLCATGNQPDRRPQFGSRRGAEESPRSAEDLVLHPQQRPHRRHGVGVERRDVHDTQRRRLFSGGAQRGRELLLVGIGCRQPENPVLVTLGGQRVDQRRNGFAVVGDQQPGSRGVIRCVGSRGVGLLPADLVTVVGDGLRLPLLIVLCGKLCQHFHGLIVTARAAE